LSYASLVPDEISFAPRKTFRKRLRAVWKHSLFTSIEHYYGVEHPGAVMNVEDALRVSFKRLNGIVDAFGDAQEIPFANEIFDSCLCTEVLEHVPDPMIVLKEIRRILKPGGRVLLTVPFAVELHQTPYDFWRFTPFGLQQLFKSAGFEVERITPRGNFPTVAGAIAARAIYRLGAREIRRDGAVSLHWLAKPFVWIGCAVTQGIAKFIGSFSKDDGFVNGYIIVAKRI